MALRGAGRHKDMSDAFEIMLSKTSESPDPKIRGKDFDFGVDLLAD